MCNVFASERMPLLLSLCVMDPAHKTDTIRYLALFSAFNGLFAQKFEHLLPIVVNYICW